MSETKQGQSGASGSSVHEKARETVEKAKATASASKPSSSKAKPKRTPRKKAATGRKRGPNKPKKQDQLVKHDPAKHEGNQGGARPDLEPKPRDKALEEVRRVRQENEDHWAIHDRVVVEGAVEGLKGTFEVTTAGGLTYIKANNVVLDHDGLINARHVLDAAFQAVS